jgi:8-oxo-dGTP diphosphatase
MIKKRIHVSCAIIERDGHILAARRSDSVSMPGKWEFPGGKMKPREEPEDCVQREILEELGLAIKILRPLPPYFHEYKDFEILLYPFICTPVKTKSGEVKKLTLKDHSEVRWDRPENLTTLDWAEADIPVLEAYIGLKRALPAGGGGAGPLELPGNLP